MPFQKSNGKNGAMVVAVPASTGIKNFAGSSLGSFYYRHFAIVINPVGIFNHYNGVIHYDAQTKQQGKEHNEIKGNTGTNY